MFARALALASLILPSAAAQAQDAPQWMRGSYFSIHAAAANPHINSISNQSTNGFLNATVATTDTSDGVIFAPSFAIGYNLRQVGLPMRVEVEYTVRGKVEHKETPIFSGFATSKIGAFVENQALMANIFLDFDWEIGRFKPFIGWGVGAAKNEGEAFQLPNSKGRHERINNVDLDLAWSLMAGASLPFGRGWRFDTRYRYANLGTVTFGPTKNGIGGTRLQVDSLTTHEFAIGFRYTF